MAEAAAHLSPATRCALDALVQTQVPGEPVDGDQIPLFPIRSELAAVKEGAGAGEVETVLDEIAKLKQLRALGCPRGCSATCLPSSLRITGSARRANRPVSYGVIRPRCATRLLAALCWQREREITDNLVELLIRIAHRVGVRAEEKVDIELMKYAKKIIGKAKSAVQTRQGGQGTAGRRGEGRHLPRRRREDPGGADSGGRGS